MKIAIIDHINKYNISTDNNYAVQFMHFLSEHSEFANDEIYFFHRAAFDQIEYSENYTRISVKDNLETKLRWCDNPALLYRSVSDYAPDVVHMFNLGLPLHFRWLARNLSSQTKVIGHHTGEKMWVQLRLFLMQAGLRPVDAFIFSDASKAQSWRKASVILPHQPVIEIPQTQNGSTNRAAVLLRGCYQNLLSN
jgi:hypothetical protein